MLLYRYIFFTQINKVKSQYMLTAQKLDETKKSFSKKLLSVQEEERKRLSRELHDGIGQSLYSILILLNIIDSELDGKGSENLQNAKEITATTMKDINRIARSLRPSILDDLGFRSEERRVGKECRCWWSRDKWKEKEKERDGVTQR